MANRVLRDWTDSEVMDNLSPGAEVFFTRLIMRADDYGSYHANPKLLKAGLFPLKTYSETKVAEWLNECIDAGLVFEYEVAGKTYIRIDKFGQRMRNMRNKFPEPLSDKSPQVAANGRKSPPETRNQKLETETRNESETETESASAQVDVWPRFDDWWDLYDKGRSKAKCKKKWEKISQEVREEIMIHTGDYVRATPDKQYRKDPTTYLNNESWNDEIIVRTNGKGIAKDLQHTVAAIDNIVADRDYSRTGQRGSG